jgi:uncharacterized protein YkwD
MNRRHFLNLALAAPMLPYLIDSLSNEELTRIRQRLLATINQQRRQFQLRDVELDSFATRVAEQHAAEMTKAGFTSHWNQAGYKPYLRYSQLGGNDAVRENVAGRWSNSGIVATAVADIVENLHQAMFLEKPPHDGHRQNILYPFHTHLGLAVAYNGYRVQLAQEFVARYVEFGTTPRRVRKGEVIELQGEILYDGFELHNIEVRYEAAPQPMTVAELNRTGDYQFPTEKIILRPQLTAGYRYQDGTAGVIDYQANLGEFRCPIDFKATQPGVYIIIVWLKQGEKPFPASNICVEVK